MVEGAECQFSSAFYVIVAVSSHHIDTGAPQTENRDLAKGQKMNLLSWPTRNFINRREYGLHFNFCLSVSHFLVLTPRGATVDQGGCSTKKDNDRRNLLQVA